MNGAFVPLCRKGLHPMEPANTAIRGRGVGRRPSTVCRTCERSRERNVGERQKAIAEARAKRPTGYKAHYSTHYWEDGDGYGHCRVEAEGFEYAVDEDFGHRARRILLDRLLAAGGDKPPLRTEWYAETDRERDYANPDWTVSVTFRSSIPVPQRQADHGEAA